MRGPVPLLLVVVLLLSGCGSPTVEATGSTDQPPLPLPTLPSSATPTPDPVATSGWDGAAFEVRVLGERGHDPSAFTQGLEFDGERLYESRGLRGQSAMTEIDPSTGEVLRRTDLGEEYFAEGATVIGDRIIQITWQEHTAFVYDVDTLAVTSELTYEGEGWGICDLPSGEVWMSNGTSTLTQRDPDTFEALRTVTVTLDGQPVSQLNELECDPTGAGVLANVWQTNTILLIDVTDGAAVPIDASAIANDRGQWAEDPSTGDVLNGIAWDPVEGVWLLTGKLWPVTYEVAFDCVDECDAAFAVTPRHRADRFTASRTDPLAR